jgi:hypothetical protein
MLFALASVAVIETVGSVAVAVVVVVVVVVVVTCCDDLDFGEK